MAGGRGRPGPPRWMRRLLGWVLPRRDRRHLLGEMERLYRWKLERDGPAHARLWYARQVLFFPVRLMAEAVRSAPERLAGAAAGIVWDIRYSIRRLRRRPSYVWTAVLTLGVAVGGVASVYNAANWVLLRPVPGVGDRSELVTIRLEMGGPSSPAFPISAPDLAEIADGTEALSGLAGGFEVNVNLLPVRGGEPRRVTASVVTANYFAVLRSSPARGRFFDESTGATDGVAVVSHRLWRSVWGGSSSVVGGTIRVNGERFTVVAVAPEGFHGAELPGRTDLWFPAGVLPALDRERPADVLTRRGAALFSRLVGRLSPGATPERVSTEFLSMIERIRQEHTRHSFGTLYEVGTYEGIGLSPRVRGRVRHTLGLLAGAASLLLILAVTNLANLGLSRVLSQSDSNGVRIALGASRFQVARGVLMDHVPLGVGGAAAALTLTIGATRFFERVSLSSLGASLEGMRVDGRVAVFTCLAALAAALLSALAPAGVATRRGVLAALHARRRGSRGTARLQTVMAGTQVALSMVLVVAAGLLIRTVSNLHDVDAGFEPADAIRFAIDPAAQRYDDEEVAGMLERLRVSLMGRPGVRAAGFSAQEPLRTGYLTYAFWPPDRPRSERPVVAAQLNVGEGFLEAMGVRLVAGRTFRPQEMDRGGGPVSAVVSESVARAAFPGRRPASVVGRTFPGRRERPVRVVGVVEDPRVTGVAYDPPPVIFLPTRTAGPGPVTFWVRGAAPSETVAEYVRDAVRAVDSTLPLFDVRTVREQLDRLIVEQRVMGTLALSLAVVGLLLAAVGLNGLLWYTVAERRREIGIRAALGATRGRIARTMMRRGVIATAAGAAVGLAGSVLVGRLIESRLFGVDRIDPMVYAAGAVITVVAAVVASWAPAHRATRVAPRDVLSTE